MLAITQSCNIVLNLPKSSMRAVFRNWTNSSTRDRSPSGNILSISFTASVYHDISFSVVLTNRESTHLAFHCFKVCVSCVSGRLAREALLRGR